MDATLAPNGATRYLGQERCGRLHVATLDGVVTLERSGPAWQVAGRGLEGSHISSLLFEPRRGGLFAGVVRGGLHASLDGGKTWERRTTGLTEEYVFSLACTERDGATVLYAGTEPASLFQSTDYGETWEELPALRNVPGTETWWFPSPPHVAHVKDVTFDPRDTRTMYVSVEQGALLKSTDAGQTWQELAGYSRADDHAYKDVHRVALRPSNPDQVYFTSGAGLYHSADGGETWGHFTDDTDRIGYPDGLLFSPEDDNVLIMSGANRNPGTWRETHDANAAVARSRDGGQTWELVTRGLPDHLRCNIEALSLAAYPGGFDVFAGTTDGDVFTTEDQGEHWTRIVSGLAPVSKGRHYMPLVAAAGSRP